MAGWENFFVAQVGASAALAGLVLVGVSINLTRIMSIPGLPSIALESLPALLSLLIISSVTLVPEQPMTALGLEITAVAVIAWGSLLNLQISRWRRTAAEYRRTALGISLLGQGAALPFVVAGLVVLSGSVGGLYWIVPGMALSYVSVFLNAWVLLVEINR